MIWTVNIWSKLNSISLFQSPHFLSISIVTRRFGSFQSPYAKVCRLSKKQTNKEKISFNNFHLKRFRTFEKQIYLIYSLYFFAMILLTIVCLTLKSFFLINLIFWSKTAFPKSNLKVHSTGKKRKKWQKREL